ncbi:MAG TPA: 2-succinyl-6-hydroxy-2,4-cyclohexadiene-1-carboxylate synthase [Candidatus Hydrogenedentes bacterium]|nr:2-succinyl-6-hydroxy-2,4-cyclohexadiene-1-carboxylate synthase [Candidatus Hydrogenedentota bacterium]
MTRELHYVVLNPTGNVTVLFLHGFMGSGEDWRLIAQDLSRACRCVLVDLPGHGYTPVRSDSAAYTMAAVSRDVMHLMDRVSPGRFFVVGYSMGARLGLYLATEYRERIEGLIMESASPGLRTERERAERRERDDRLAEELETGNWETFLRQWYARPLFETLRKHGSRFEELLERRRMNNPRELARVLRGMGTGAQPSLWDALHEIAAPVLLVVGERDPKYRTLAESMCEMIPRAAMAVMPDAGHNVHFEKPTDYTRLLQGLLDDLREGAAL